MSLCRSILRPFREVACLFGLVCALLLLAPFLLFGTKSTRGRNQLFLLFLFGWLAVMIPLAMLPGPHDTGVGALIFWPPCLIAYLIIAPKLGVSDDLVSLRLWLPERETIRAGTRVIRLFDFRMSVAHRRRLVGVTDAMWETLDRSPSAHLRERGLVEAYRGLAGRPIRKHRFDIPADPGKPPRTNLIFLHGHGGNLLLYPVAWQDFAEKYGVRILLPTFEYGNWNSLRSVETVRSLVAELQGADASIPIYLAGISQGGAGVSRAGAELGANLAGLIYISPTMEMKVLSGKQFQDAWRGRRALVFQGGQDRNVHPRTVIPAVESMREAGVGVEFVFDEAEDHFFFFGQRERVQGIIAEWMGLSE